MSFYNEKMAERAKAQYCAGTKIKITHISDGSYPQAVGQIGTVLFVDDAGQIHCRMENGTGATVCEEYGDRFFKIN